ncbi:MAG: 30S ribosomal protein S16 [Candidatus Yanofskybacteria bacterium CG10_big_fil_rev_8_21_14_0_10_36_16]|uniref:Small ribosomal subunit protein bS16 n=1 Tax=Candidatus Yanofskybacteria bacterium CG10_big_fil_rev_8_21_14_0_10_36_16 TaxID=1975096 RepID=A0A2J0Q872_9BACT|nr:MAG: 30S ribosomal protein S16 [Candidatus Yanofskybacteria bacterium CG10_big_fil_rev_8_21_14_0_10_36_16]
MLKIRLQRVGKKGQAMYRLVVAEHTKNPKGAYLELLGSYNPHSKDLQANGERIKHWVSNGAQMSDTVNNLLISKKVIEGIKVQLKLKTKKKQTEQKQENTPVKVATAEAKEEPVSAENKQAKDESKEDAKEESKKSEDRKEEVKNDEPKKEETKDNSKNDTEEDKVEK